MLAAADEGQPGRSSDHERIVCKLTGVAVQEIFVCDHVLKAFGVAVGETKGAASRGGAPPS